MAPAQTPRRFYVRARDRNASSPRMVEETSLEGAAIAYIGELPDLGSDPEVSVIVREMATDREHCFRVDLRTGDTSPCG